MLENDKQYTISSDIEFLKFNKNEYLLYNSKLNKYTKISQKYYELLILVDGNKTVSEIKIDFEKKCNISLLESQITTLLNRLKQFGVFGHDDSIKKNIKIPDYIKFGFIFIPTSLVSRIVPFLGFLFKKKIYVALFIWCFVTFSINIFTNYHQYNELNIIQLLPYFIILTLVSIIFHELGHATAAHYFNVKHGGIGFGFYIYFMPVFFADVTDVWKLKKWKRIVVNSAGIYFEIIFCFILTIIGFLTKNQIIEILAFVIAGRALYNFLPFFRADGYWILSDLLNKPNLSYHSFNNLKLIVNSFLTKKSLKFEKTDYFIAIYGLLNILLIGVFFYYQIFLNGELIIHFPQIILNIINSIWEGEFTINFNDLIKYLSILIFYIILIKMLMRWVRIYFKNYFISLSK